jgi:hypothetical protein
MNIALDLSKSQLSKLRNGHGIRITPSMLGSGVDLIIDPMTYHNMAKKLDKGKGAIINMGSAEIEQNKMEGTGLFAGAGNKSGKISRMKKAKKWRDFSDDTLRKGIDTGRYGYEQFKEATNPLQSEGKKALKGLSKMFGGEMEDESDEEVEGGKISFKGLKKAYNKKVKNTKLGKALRESAGNYISDGYDKATNKIGEYKNLNPLAEHMKNTRKGSVRKATQMTGLGRMRPAVVRPNMDEMKKYMAKHGKGLRLQGDGMRLSGGRCCGCGMMNDQFTFADQAL